MLITQQMMANVDAVATFRRIDKFQCERWNRNRHADEPRLLGGWVWTARYPKTNQINEGRSLQSKTAAYILAWQALIAKTPMRQIDRPRLHVVTPSKRRVG